MFFFHSGGFLAAKIFYSHKLFQKKLLIWEERIDHLIGKTILFVKKYFNKSILPVINSFI